MTTCRVTLAARDRYESFSPRTCGRKAVKDGLCTMHLKVEEKRQARDAEFQAARERSARREEQANLAARELRAILQRGAVIPEYGDFKRGYTGGLILSAQAVEALLDRLGVEL